MALLLILCNAAATVAADVTLPKSLRRARAPSLAMAAAGYAS